MKLRESGQSPESREHRARPIDDFLVKIEELVVRSGGRLRADVVHRRITAMGFAGGERTTRRAVAEVKGRFAAGQRRVFRPWIPEPVGAQNLPVPAVTCCFLAAYAARSYSLISPPRIGCRRIRRRSSRSMTGAGGCGGDRFRAWCGRFSL